MPKNLLDCMIPYARNRVLTTADQSYTNLILCLNWCLMIGRKPNMTREMKSRVNTLVLLLSLEESRMEAKKMALMLVGEKTLFTEPLSYFGGFLTG